MQLRSVVWACFAVLLSGAATGMVIGADKTGAEYFEKQVRPILAARCFECHSGQIAKPKGGLRLDSRSSALKGGDTGPAVVPGKLKESLLVDAINYGELYQMPPKSRLPAEEIAALTKWVEMGAPWPADTAAGAAGGSGGEFNLSKRKAEHWCWQPIKAVDPPAVKNAAWIKQPLDRFILAKLEAKGLLPALPADERTLIRRAYFDLIGLPPSAEEVEKFLAVSPSLPLSVSPSGEKDGGKERRREGAKDNYEEMVDSLLASPHFGERWGRHWLDLVRYAESRGHEFDYNIPNAFEYRDYVIRALNADVPYDQFVIEHVAGDLLEKPRLHPQEKFNESIIGTGFWFLGEWCHSPVDIRKDECDRIDNMLDVFSKTILGITVACARCHDHKFDAISQRDYYALAGFLQSSSYRLTRFQTWERDRQIAADLTALDAKFRPRFARAIAAVLRPRIDELAKRLAANTDQPFDEIGVLETDLRGTEIVVDYAKPAPGQWMTDGPTFGSGPVLPGQLVLTGDPAAPLEVATYGAARRDSFWGEIGVPNGNENDAGRLAGWVRAGRTLKTPTFTLQSGLVHYLIEGAGHAYAVVDSHAMINGPLHAELLKETGGNSDLPTRWITHDLSRYAGQRVHLEFSPKEDEDFRVLMVVEGRERPAAPIHRPNRLVQTALSSSNNGGRNAACSELAQSTLELLTTNRLATDAEPRDRAALANWLVSQIKADHSPGELTDLVAAYSAEKEKIGERIRHESRLCLAMWDGTPVDESVLIRGNHKTVGDVVRRELIEALQPDRGARNATEGVPYSTSEGVRNGAGAGRLELAQQLVDPCNPLVSRVIVNRVWQHLLGRGIVPSVDNFGVLGQPPTHPELLDCLADEFIHDGWSLKRLIRGIMLSSTYKQGSEVRVQESEVGQTFLSAIRTAEAADPENLLFHRQNLKRLEGEAIRDAILAISGRLDRTLYGPSVPVYLTPFMQGRGRPKDSGPLDSAGRRSIYVAVRRNFLSPMMLAFDTPIPFTTIGRRNTSNVPAQALILMNDPFVAEQSRLWARKLLAENASPTERIRRMYLAAFSREPTSTETGAALGFLDQQAREYGLASEKAHSDERVWADFGHVIFNVKEFVLVN
jgi:hypothetical protein